jgi:hypothetical protein
MVLLLFAPGCQVALKTLTRNLGKWDMLGPQALVDPVAAAGGSASVLLPPVDDICLSRRQLASASPEQLAAYYAPVYVQQRADCAAQRYPYPPYCDCFGHARLCCRPGGGLTAHVDGPPTVYVLCRHVCIEGTGHLQLTYTAWYPAHPRTKKVDLEAAPVDSCVVRVTLDQENAPLFYETVLACGCYHKVFVERWVEEAALRAYGAPECGKRYGVERSVKRRIAWEVGGVVDEPRDGPRRPVVLLKAGEHRVLGLTSAAGVRLPAGADSQPYALAPYADLYAVPVEGSCECAPFFDMDHGARVWGAERVGEAWLFALFGVDAAGHPRADDRILLHFDQARWTDPANYGTYLRLPPGLFQGCLLPQN